MVAHGFVLEVSVPPYGSRVGLMTLTLFVHT
jgi:hypothetical protein